MTARSLLKLLLIFAGVVGLLALLLSLHLRLDRAPRAPQRSIVSLWQGGTRIARAVVESRAEIALAERETQEGVTRVIDDVIDDAPILSKNPFLFSMSFVPARDGIELRFRGQRLYLTPDELLKLGAYGRALTYGEVRFNFGVDADLVFAAFAKELRISPTELLAESEFRRVALSRRLPKSSREATEVTIDNLHRAAVDAGLYLARVVLPDGKYRYQIDAFSGEEANDYNLPRHAGATWYLAEVARITRDRRLYAPVRRAARHLVDVYLKDCGTRRCVVDGDRADLGSSALGLLALTSLVESGISPELSVEVAELADFLRSQQREDGEFQHVYDRAAKRPIDVQFLYYTGEAAFALSRAHRVLEDPRDLRAASRALARLVEHPAWYVAWRYYWGAEHWTCHAMNDLWDRAPNREALDFCLDWQEFVRNTRVQGREATPEYDFASSSGPFVPPQIVVSATRMEAAVSTLFAARRARLPPTEIERLEQGIVSTLGFLLRSQYSPGPRHLLHDPDLMQGAFPASEIDGTVRIDYPQHAGAGLLEYFEFLDSE